MAMLASDIERLIKAGIPDAEVTIRDLAGDGDHYSAIVVSEAFRGKSRVQQHKLVTTPCGEMGGVHARPANRPADALICCPTPLYRTCREHSSV
jgi:stress-induced morphogen